MVTLSRENTQLPLTEYHNQCLLTQTMLPKVFGQRINFSWTYLLFATESVFGQSLKRFIYLFGHAVWSGGS